MLLSHKHKFIYTKTIKTASSSVERFFEPFCLQEDEHYNYDRTEEYISKTGIVGSRTAIGLERQASVWWNHMPALTIKSLVGDEVWDQYYKFCVIRNPFDQLVSAFNYFSHISLYSSRHARYMYKILYSLSPAIVDQLEKNYLLGIGEDDLKKSFERWLESMPLPLDENKYLIDGDLCMDYVIRFESLAEGIANVCNRLNLDYDSSTLPHMKKSKKVKIPLEHYYNENSIRMVQHAYNKQLELFNYDVPWG